MTEQNQSNEDDVGFFTGSFIVIILLVVVTALIVGLVTITRTWEKTDIRFQHRDGNFSVVKKTWWGLSTKKSTYTHRNSGWNYFDTNGSLRPLVDIDETSIDIKDASRQPGNTTVIQSGMEVDEK